MYEIKLNTGETVEALNRQMEETENQASILTFTLLVNSPHFNSFEEFITKIEVYHNEYKIFDGRVINLKPNMDSKGIFSCDVTCESSLNYLNDTRVGKWEIHPGEYTLTETVTTLDPSIIYTNVTVKVFLELILNNHNAKVLQDKKILLGNITIEDTVYCYTDRETSLNIIQEKLVKSKGGYIQIREVDGNKYLDYLAEPPIITLNIIELAVNMVNINRQGLWKGVYTRLIPFGKDGLNIKDINNGIEYIEDTELAARYGIVEIVENFSDITVAENLIIKARKRLTELNQELYAIECNSLDLSSIDNNFDEFQISQYCRLKNNILGLNELNRIICKTIDFDEEQNIKLKFSNELPAATMRATRNEQRLVTNEATTKRTQESLNSTNETIKIIKDDLVIIEADVVIVKEDITTLEEDVATKVNLTTVENKIAIAKGEANSYTDEQVTIVSNKITSVYKPKGSVATYADLPSINNTIGDVYNVVTGTKPELNGMNYVWSASGWDTLGASVDLSPYYTGSQSDNKYVAKEVGKSLMLDVDKTKLDGIEANAEVNNISDINATDLTDSTDTTLHYHATDRNRANHSGTQLSATISDFASTVRVTVLTGLSTTTNAIISATDTVLGALGKLQKQITDNLSTLASHIGNVSNPHSTTKLQVGLGNVDNTTDLLKPISTATQTALNLKVDKVTGKSLLLDAEITRLSGMATGANNYTHPTTHPPAIILQDVSNRFVTDAEKSTWNGKATQSNIDTSIAAIKIGGRNLIILSKLGSYGNYNTVPTIVNGVVTTTGAGTAFSLTISLAGWTPENKQYTLSGIMKKNGLPVTNIMWEQKCASTYRSSTQFFYVDDSTGKFIITETYSGSSVWIFHVIIAFDVGDIITIDKFKMETGNKDTDFILSPEDIDSTISLKVDKVIGKSLISDTEIARLASVSNYKHPSSHAPSIITQDASNRFVTDTEKAAWNSKATPANIDTSINAIKIGGNNLILDTATPFTVTGTGGVNQVGLLWSIDSSKTASKQITVSYDVVCSAASGTFQLQVATNPWLIGDTNHVASLTKQHISYTYTMPATTGYTKLALRLDYLTGTATISNLKIAIGNKELEWTPAIEDMAYKMTHSTTANRPVPTYVAQPHYDDTLGKPIWCHQFTPTVIWHDAAGATV